MKYKIGDKIIFKEPLMGVECKEGTIVKEVFGKNDITKITNVDYKCYCVDNFGSTIKVKHKDLECVTEIYQDGSQGLKYKIGDRVKFVKDCTLKDGKVIPSKSVWIVRSVEEDYYLFEHISEHLVVMIEHKAANDSCEKINTAPSITKRINDKHNILNGLFNTDGSVDGEKLIKKLEENQVFVLNNRPQRPTKPASTPDDKARGIHYEKAAMQPLEVMQRVMTKEQFKGFLFGNFLKYRMRSEFKGQHESDEYKAKQYAYWLEMVNDGHVINPTKDKVPYDYKYSII